MVKVKIDGKAFKVKDGSTILDVALEEDIPIPTLCHYEEVSPAGNCRLCVVEIVSQKNHPLVCACNTPVEKGMEVLTRSKKVIASRKMAMELLLARAPRSEKILELARQIGVKPPPFQVKENECILCGLCVRACREMVGREAIAFITRGPQREKETPSIQPLPERCIACGTCVYLCPTRYIKMVDVEDIRIIWDKVFRAKEHLISGRFYAPVDLIKYTEKAEGIEASCFSDDTSLYLEKKERSDKSSRPQGVSR